jgi:hypothetical protein
VTRVPYPITYQQFSALTTPPKTKAKFLLLAQVPIMTYTEYSEEVSKKFGMKHLMEQITRYLHDTGKVPTSYILSLNTVGISIANAK